MFEQVAREQQRTLAPLSDDLKRELIPKGEVPLAWPAPRFVR